MFVTCTVILHIIQIIIQQLIKDAQNAFQLRWMALSKIILCLILNLTVDFTLLCQADKTYLIIALNEIISILDQYKRFVSDGQPDIRDCNILMKFQKTNFLFLQQFKFSAMVKLAIVYIQYYSTLTKRLKLPLNNWSSAFVLKVVMVINITVCFLSHSKVNNTKNAVNPMIEWAN